MSVGYVSPSGTKCHVCSAAFPRSLTKLCYFCRGTICSGCSCYLAACVLDKVDLAKETICKTCHKREALRIKKETEAIDAAAEGDIEAQIDSAVEDEMVESLELAVAYELRVTKLEHLKNLTLKSGKKAEKAQKEYESFKAWLAVETAELKRISAAIHDYVDDRQMPKFYDEARRRAAALRLIATDSSTENKFTHYNAVFKMRRQPKK